MFASPITTPREGFYDRFRNSYERNKSARVRVFEQEKSASSGRWRNRDMKVIEIGPDPPVLYRKYIWGRRSE